MADKRIVAMPAFTDPDLPEAAEGTLNLPVDEHPVEHDADYGGGMEMPEAEQAAPSSEDREEWMKEDWKNQAKKYGLPVSGNMDELQARVEEYEAEQGSDED